MESQSRKILFQSNPEFRYSTGLLLGCDAAKSNGSNVSKRCSQQFEDLIRKGIIAFITDRGTVRDILIHLGEPISAPLIAPARGPPRRDPAAYPTITRSM